LAHDPFGKAAPPGLGRGERGLLDHLHTNDASLLLLAAAGELPTMSRVGSGLACAGCRAAIEPAVAQPLQFSSNLRGAADFECHFTSQLRTRSRAIVSLPAAVGSLQVVDLKSLDNLEIR
jgi:hypothetical protein